MPNKYWKGEIDPGYWIFNWKKNASIEFLFKNKKEFLYKYIEITNRYRILLPIDHNIKSNDRIVSEILEFSPDTLEGHWFHLIRIYSQNYKSKPVFPSEMYVKNEKGEISNRIMIGVDKNFDIGEDVTNLFTDPLLQIWLTISNNQVKLTLTLTSNAFFPSIWDGESLTEIDNSELANLNTPRLNSYIRDLKFLASEFKADSFEFDNTIEDSSDDYSIISQDGIFLNGKILYND